MRHEKSQSGFSLVEIIVSMAIFGILITTMVVGFQRTSPGADLANGAKAFATHLRLVQAWAQSSTDGQTGIPPARGYGIFYDYPGGVDYTLFENEQDDEGVADYNSATDRIRQTYGLPAGVVWESCQYQNAPVSGRCTIVCAPMNGGCIVGTDTAVGQDGLAFPPFRFALRSTATDTVTGVILKRWTGLIYEEIVP